MDQCWYARIGFICKLDLVYAFYGMKAKGDILAPTLLILLAVYEPFRKRQLCLHLRMTGESILKYWRQIKYHTMRLLKDSWNYHSKTWYSWESYSTELLMELSTKFICSGWLSCSVKTGVESTQVAIWVWEWDLGVESSEKFCFYQRAFSLCWRLLLFDD